MATHGDSALAPGGDGRHADTTALARALAALDVRAPQTGRPLSEALLFGIGGGPGGGYWLFEFTGAPKALVLGARHRWHQPHLFLSALCERLGVPLTAHETGSTRAAGTHLAAALAAGRRPLAWVDQARGRTCAWGRSGSDSGCTSSGCAARMPRPGRSWWTTARPSRGRSPPGRSPLLGRPSRQTSTG